MKNQRIVRRKQLVKVEKKRLERNARRKNLRVHNELMKMHILFKKKEGAVNA
tara:strand:- start:217 stop:372 length:156 start_codon:yes stop_codon:yes gene_type:complete